MRSFWSEPFLWVHAAGLAALPIFLGLCLMGLSVGDPVLPVGLEILLVATIGVLPIVWMQWSRPFYIFSLIAVAIKPGQLTPVQRQILALFKRQESKLVAITGSALLIACLWQLYRLAPIAAGVAPFPSTWRLGGLLLAGLAFLGCNLFLLVPLSVFTVLLATESTFAAIEPYAVEQIQHSFLIPGFQVNQLLPKIVVPSQPAPVSPLPPDFAAPPLASPPSGEDSSLGEDADPW
ncbi:hypothetical protein BST81_14615 [Leptolyngbya sp. 'hensonii']|uniref:low-complexity tail membrane protein n=1 Tax=Leptolyngbya sp. 'hensonii' TaxID=1922337 RepID=UPI00094F69B6|nr:low-complexity tail membrane protein [Leptolyngbya sp. 'hensonii']OLP17558.1 hypothetical protein BST81_14615 [Leptolyngbya sp. 'hensonii']